MNSSYNDISRDNETAQFPPLAKPQSYTPSNSVWGESNIYQQLIHIVFFSDNGNHTRVRIPSLPDKLDESNNIKETSKLQVRPKTIIQPLSSNDTQVKIISVTVELT